MSGRDVLMALEEAFWNDGCLAACWRDIGIDSRGKAAPADHTVIHGCQVRASAKPANLMPPWPAAPMSGATGRGR